MVRGPLRNWILAHQAQPCPLRQVALRRRRSSSLPWGWLQMAWAASTLQTVRNVRPIVHARPLSDPRSLPPPPPPMQSHSGQPRDSFRVSRGHHLNSGRHPRRERPGRERSPCDSGGRPPQDPHHGGVRGRWRRAAVDRAGAGDLRGVFEGRSQHAPSQALPLSASMTTTGQRHHSVRVSRRHPVDDRRDGHCGAGRRRRRCEQRLPEQPLAQRA